MSGIARIEIDGRANTLSLVPIDSASRPPAGSLVRVLVDIGARGRLLGVELDDAYFQISAADGQDALARSAEVEARIDCRGAIVIPRRTVAYEISFPSGNQCWRTRAGNQICSLVT